MFCSAVLSLCPLLCAGPTVHHPPSPLDSMSSPVQPACARCLTVPALQRGYSLHERIVRAAEVGVSRAE
jgi:hypothetical protein